MVHGAWCGGWVGDYPHMLMYEGLIYCIQYVIWVGNAKSKWYTQLVNGEYILDVYSM